MNEQAKRLVTTMVATTIVTAGSVSPAMASRMGGFQVADGRVSVNDDLVLEDLSMVLSQLEYIFLYLPGLGLLTVATQDFDGAEVAGEFRKNSLRIDIAGTVIELDSGVPMLPHPAVAFVRIDHEFRLQTEKPTIGYGTSPDAAYVFQRFAESSP